LICRCAARSRFDVAYGDGTQSIDPAITATNWDGGSALTFNVPTTTERYYRIGPARERIERIDAASQS